MAVAERRSWRTGTTQFDFMSRRGPFMITSAVLTAIVLVSLIVRGLNFGIDFTGGVLVQASYQNPANLSAVRAALARAGQTDAQVQSFGSSSSIMIRLPPQPLATQDSEAFRNKLVAALRVPDPTGTVQSVETIGPQIGQDLAEQGGLAVLFALILIFVYVMIRFRWKFAVGAIVATVHDVLLTVGFFSLLGLQFDLTVLAAVLAVLGYSLNDTVVVYDRIRDNFRLMRRGTPASIINASVNQTLSRTIITSFVTLLSVLALLFLGGPTLEGFSIALTVGIIIGTYSSIYVASAMALVLKVAPADMMPPKRKEFDDLP